MSINSYINNFSSCKKWGVVTTIFGTAPSEAVRRFLYRRSNWCVVVVGDKGKPDSARTFGYLILNCITEFKALNIRYRTAWC